MKMNKFTYYIIHLKKKVQDVYHMGINLKKEMNISLNIIVTLIKALLADQY